MKHIMLKPRGVCCSIGDLILFGDYTALGIVLGKHQYIRDTCTVYVIFHDGKIIHADPAYCKVL
jgi:hypothetical protein